MPWTAIPLSDLTFTKHLKQRFGPECTHYFGTLLIVDPMGKILQCYGELVIHSYGALGYPFNDERIKILDSEDDAAARQPSLKTLLGSSERDYLITNKQDKVQFSQFFGKRVVIYFDWYRRCSEFLEKLKERYIQLKGTDDEFEVIHVREKNSKNEHDANLPWSLDKVYSRARDLFNSFSHSSESSIIAFDQDGRLVRKAMHPTFEDMDFPFYAGGLEKEALIQVVTEFKLDRMHYFSPGEIYSFNRSYHDVFKYFDSSGLYYANHEHLRPVDYQSSAPSSPLIHSQTNVISVPTAYR